MTPITFPIGYYQLHPDPSMNFQMGSSLSEILVVLPGLSLWLRRVFWVMGGYMFTTALLTVYIALTAFRARAKGAVGIVALAKGTALEKPNCLETALIRLSMYCNGSGRIVGDGLAEDG